MASNGFLLRLAIAFEKAAKNLLGVDYAERISSPWYLTDPQHVYTKNPARVYASEAEIFSRFGIDRLGQDLKTQSIAAHPPIGTLKRNGYPADRIVCERNDNKTVMALTYSGTNYDLIFVVKKTPERDAWHLDTCAIQTSDDILFYLDCHTGANALQHVDTVIEAFKKAAAIILAQPPSTADADVTVKKHLKATLEYLEKTFATAPEALYRESKRDRKP